MPSLFIVCGVSASGKSTIGRLLATEIAGLFLEGDDFHPSENLIKMRSKIALTDDDRREWIKAMADHINTIEVENLAPQGIVLSCSALTTFVQAELEQRCNFAIQWIKLELPQSLALERSKAREHFMPPELIASQYAAWLPPKQGITIDAAQPKEKILEQIIRSLRAR